MARTTLNEMTEARTLSTDEQKTLKGGLFGFGGFNPWGPFFTPRFGYNPYSGFASGYGMFRPVAPPNTFVHGVQAVTFAGMAAASASATTLNSISALAWREAKVTASISLICRGVNGINAAWRKNARSPAGFAQ